MGYFICLHFKCYPLPSFPSRNPPSPLPASVRMLPDPTTHSHLTYLALPYTGALSLHRTKGPLFPLINKAFLCYICAWSHGLRLENSFVVSALGVHRGGRLRVHIVVLPMKLQTPLAPSVLSLSPPLGTPCSVQWLAGSICLCICQALAEPLRRQILKRFILILLNL